MKIRVNRARQWKVTLLWATGALFLIIGSVFAYRYFTQGTTPIPASLRSQLTFSPFILPLETKDATTSDYKFTTAEGAVKILSYKIHVQNSGNNSITVSEYPEPTEFTEIPEYKDRFLTNVAKQYDVVQTANGTIYLGRLTKQGNQQLGILLERGLVVFMSPGRDLPSAQWRNIGDQLEIQKIIN
jgi:hypothetical protein